jgi:tetratricopeptide (TPR) repeat protein
MQRFLTLIFLAGGLLRAETTLVLPFANHSSSSNLDWIGESIAESIHDALASSGQLVLDRSDRLEAYRRRSLRPGAELTRASMIKLGESLDASNLIYGFYEVIPAANGKDQAKASVRITARILDLKRSHQSPEFGQTGALEDLTALEVRLGYQALSSFHPKTLPSEQEFVAARPSVRIDAVESYIRGLMANNAEQRHRFFTQAARLDNQYSQPCYQLGKIYWGKKDYKVASGWLARVTRTDPHYLESQFFLGLSRYQLGDFAGAAQSFEIVAAGIPLNEVFNNLGAALNRQNNPTADAVNFQKAVEGDSGDPDYHFNLGYSYWRSGRFSDAVKSFREVLARNPEDAEATLLLGRALKEEGPRPTDPKSEARERLKANYDEAAYRQLQAELSKE